MADRLIYFFSFLAVDFVAAPRISPISRAVLVVQGRPAMGFVGVSAPVLIMEPFRSITRFRIVQIELVLSFLRETHPSLGCSWCAKTHRFAISRGFDGFSFMLIASSISFADLKHRINFWETLLVGCLDFAGNYQGNLPLN